MYYIGRRKTALIVTGNSLAAFIVLYYSSNALQVLISQILQGALSASATTAVPLMMTEYTSPKYRGMLLNAKMLVFFLGVWAANIIGMFSHWTNIGLFGIICSLYNLVALYYIPESPYWFSSKNKFDKCVASFRWLRGTTDESEKELNDLIKPRNKNMNKEKKSITNCLWKSLQTLFEKQVYKALTLSILLLFSYYACGKIVCTVYSIQLIKQITDSESAAYNGMLILDGITICSLMISVILSKLFSQKILLLCSLSAGTLFMYIISLYLFLASLSIILENAYISLGLLIIFSAAVSCSLAVSLTIYPEVLPLRSRGLCVCLSSIFCKFGLGTTLKISPYLFKTLGSHGAFLSFAIASTISIILIYLFVPETKNKTLHEIAHDIVNKGDKNIKTLETEKLMQTAKSQPTF